MDDRVHLKLREALYTLERAQIERLVEQAKRLNYSSETVAEGKRLLALQDEEFFELEIQRAEELGVGETERNEAKDISRLVDRKIKLRDLLLKKQEDKFVFEKYPKLKTREDYASYKIFTVNRRWWRETAYSFITLAIPTCLTTLSKDADKHGILLFKTIQGYMKDRKYLLLSLLPIAV